MRKILEQKNKTLKNIKSKKVKLIKLIKQLKTIFYYYIMESVTDKNKNINTKYTKEEINKKKEELR